MTIVYMANSASGRTMFARRLDSLDSSPLRRIDRAFEPFFSADGKWIGYNDEADFDLRKISITGEPPALITHVGREIRGAAWSSQDVIVFATEEGLFRVPPSGGTPVVVSKPDSARGERSYSWPEWLPGGKTILFSLERDSGPTAIATVPVSGGAPKVIIKDGTSPKWLPTGHLLYLAADGVLRGVPFDADALEVRGEAVPLAEAVDTKAAGAANAALSADGTLLYAPASHFAHRRLVWVDRASGARSVLPAPVRGYVLARISPDGTRIAVDVREHSQAVYIYDIARDALDKFTDSSALDGFPVWTPDSSQIVFASTRLGRRGLFVQRVDRGGTARPLFPAGIDSPTSVTPDGQDVLFQREVGEDPKTGVDIIIGPLAGGSAKPLRSMIANEVNGEVSADGRWLAYESNEADKDLAQIYVRPFPNVEAERHLVSTADGRYPAWRADSHELFYVSPEGKIMSVAIGPGPKFSASPARVLISAPIQTQTVLRSYDVTPDGRRFLVIEDASGEATTPLTLLLNIAEALKHPSRR
jgi:serine/threonine-protein kinase